ncbi:hypothetical protein LUZ60_002025 [Juncus effusus]|nr:hypothetical protein LUZ60_002025 [Juncus effusus]
MKIKASKFLKDIITVIVTIVKNKSIAVKTKTAGLKTRLLFLGLLNNKKVLMTTISAKMNALMVNERDLQNRIGSSIETGTTFESYNGARAIIPRNASRGELFKTNCIEQIQVANSLDFEYFEGEDSDLTHSLFQSDQSEDEEEEECEELEFVRSSGNDGSSFNLEEEIDNVAEAFIRRHRKQLKLEKQDSFKRRYQEMLQGNV